MVTLNTRTYVPATGDRANASFVIVAEQPGKNEVERRTPMIGPAGENLNECLYNAKIRRQDCYITNVIKDLDHDLKYYIDMRKKDPIQEPGKAYMDVLEYELSKTKGIIIPMGNVALYALTNRRGITNWRGSVVESTLLPGRICVPTFHPATYTQDKLFINPKLSLNRVLITYDLIRAREQSGRTEIHKTKREVIIRPPVLDVMNFLKECHNHTRIFYDIELINNEMSCISFAWNEYKAICIPFVSPEGQFYDIEDELIIMEEIASLLESPDITKVGQNIIFDSHFLHSRYGIRTINMDDTMIAQGLLMPEYPKGLNFITSMWTDINYYKDEGKIWLGGGGDWNNGYIYNGLDSLACAASFQKQTAELEEMNNIDAYNRQVALIEPLTYMMERGVRVDIDGYGRKILSTELELMRKKEEIQALMGDINPGSPVQLMDYFYNHKGIEPIRNKKKKVTTDESALIELAGMGHNEAQLILDWRGLEVLLSRYLNFNKIDKDGRLRCSYNPVGTRYGRISSSRNIYGTGMNLQNLPFDIRTYLVADDGYIIYSIDLSQAENRLVAYIGNIDTMIQAFESGIDLHRKTASLIYGVSYDEVTSSQREMGKRGNHCHTTDTDVLTRIGWIPIADAYESGVEIATWNPSNHNIRFEEPLNWFKGTHSGLMYEFTGRYVSQFVTPEHRIPGIRRDGRFEVHEPQYLSMKEDLKWPTSGNIEGGQEFNHTWLRLLIAFQADGTYAGNGLRWHLKNPIKISRLRVLLSTLNQSYTERVQKTGFTVIYVHASNLACDIMRDMFPDDKRWHWNILQLDLSALKVLADEIFIWDGDGLNYYSKYRENIEIIQTVLHLCGYKSSIGIGSQQTYRVSKLQPHTRYPAIAKIPRHVNDVQIYCPTVSTEAFLVRREDIISVSMNSFNYGFGPASFSRLYQIPLNESKIIRNAYHKAYPMIEHGYWKYVQDQIRQNNGVLQTLFGRRIKFYQKRSEQMWNEAYSAIPQGTVGEMINERGIKFIYYNEDPIFSQVQILTQTHDSIDFEIPVSLGFEQHADIVLQIIESLESPLKFGRRDISIPCDLVVNFNLNKKLGIEIKNNKIPKNLHELSALLKDSVSKLELAKCPGSGQGSSRVISQR